MLAPKCGMVLAAGLGLRMRPLTEHCPKPLIAVAGKKLIAYSLELLEQAGVESIVVNSSYLAPMLEAYLASRRASAPVAVSREPGEPLETGGGIAKALPLLGDAPFYSLNSDAFVVDRAGVTPALQRLAEAWDDSRMDALLLLVPKEQAVGYDGAGDFFFEHGVLRRRGDAPEAPYVFTGTQILHPRLFAGCPEGAFSLNLLYDRQKTAEGALPNISAIVHDGLWLHVGTPEAIGLAERHLLPL